MIVRPSTRADLAAVDALLARSYPRLLKSDYPPSVLVTALPLISRARPELLDCGTYYVAQADAGQILGAGGWTVDRVVPRLGHVRHVVTDDRQVRKGVGRAILTRAIAEARGAGITRLHCLSTRTAVPFYGALGFVLRGPVDVALQQGISFPCLQMDLDLARDMGAT